MKNKSTKKLQLILLAVLLLAFIYNSYFLIPQKYQTAAEKYLKAALYFPGNIINFYGKKIIVFAPHCDDETLGCGGVIEKALFAGAEVYVVLITNGDGFKYAAEAEFHKLKLTPENYIKFAYLRQNESLNALSVLGLNSGNVFFLGYPDRGISFMWKDCWDKDHPYFSSFTKSYFSPYTNSFTKNTAYCGVNLLSDIEKIISSIKPDIIYIPHSMDFHIDHWSTNCFVNTAVADLSEKDKNYKIPQIYNYLVHRGSWPVPSGKHLDFPLIPPAKLQNTGTAWEILPLSPLAVERKYQAIKQYKSQLALMKNYLLSFARENEVFGIYPPVKIKNNCDNLDQNLIIVNPKSDTLKKTLEKDSSIEKIYAYEDGLSLVLILQTVKKISNKTKIKIYMAYFDEKSNLKRLIIEYQKNQLKISDQDVKIVTAASGNLIKFTISLNKMKDIQKIFFGAEIYHGNSLIDRTAYRMIEISDQR